MSKFTKIAIMQSFLKLLNEMPFDKITVKDIVDDCGINRNTFYYNFEDIYGLVDEIIEEEISTIAENHREYSSWSGRLKCVAAFALENKRAVVHLHNSVKRPQLEKYLERVISQVIGNFVSEQIHGEEISEEDKVFISDFYSYALLGLMNKWIDSGMKEDFDVISEKIGVLLDSSIRQAVKSLSENNRDIT